MAKGRAKPLHGAKKWDKTPLICSVEDCDNEFFVAKGSPTIRICMPCFLNKPVTKTQQKRIANEALLRSVGLLK